jgi:hypothetical protein
LNGLIEAHGLDRDVVSPDHQALGDGGGRAKAATIDKHLGPPRFGVYLNGPDGAAQRARSHALKEVSKFRRISDRIVFETWPKRDHSSEAFGALAPKTLSTTRDSRQHMGVNEVLSTNKGQVCPEHLEEPIRCVSTTCWVLETDDLRDAVELLDCLRNFFRLLLISENVGWMDEPDTFHPGEAST